MLIAVLPYQEQWVDEFRCAAAAMRQTLGDEALRIDHIGSTAVKGLAAKSIIDVQVTVLSLDAFSAIAPKLETIGYIHRPTADRDRPPPWEVQEAGEWRKAFFRTADGAPRRIHVHIRERDRRNQRYALLFRDYLRSSERAREAYGDFKRQLAEVVGHLSGPGGTGPYLDLKDPMLDLIASAAERWADDTTWKPGHPDA